VSQRAITSAPATDTTDADPMSQDAYTVSTADRVKAFLSPSNIGGVYVLLVMIVIFSIWVPDIFPEWDTAKQIMNTNAINALVALALIIPLSAGVFDLSVTATMTLSGVLCTYAVVNSGQPLIVGFLIAMGASVLVGVMNGVVVVVGKIDSLIATLATSFLVLAMVKWRTGSRNVSGVELSGSFTNIAQKAFGGLTLPVFYAVVLATIIWYVLEHTATGRRIYATGFNKEATRLASVRTERLRFGSLIVSSTLAGFAGIVLASNLGSGSPTAGTSYLLPAVAAVFLGATQLKHGRFNAWGTIIAVLILGTGTTGLGLAKVDQWAQDVFTGVVLIAALALTGLEVRRAGSESRRARSKRRSALTADGQVPSSTTVGTSA
jgi:ribose/xylose/arabinose/galactoside ABC-type transport system permease subunit